MNKLISLIFAGVLACAMIGSVSAQVDCLDYDNQYLCEYLHSSDCRWCPVNGCLAK